MSNITEYKDIRFKDFVKIPHTHPNKTLIKYMTLPNQIKCKQRVVRVLCDAGMFAVVNISANHKNFFKLKSYKNKDYVLFL